MHIVIKEEGADYAPEDAPRIKMPSDVLSVTGGIEDSATEACIVLLLNTKNRLISSNIVTMGLNDASLVHPREVFRQAIRANASGVILVHNHPTGETTPSTEDVRITKQLIEAGRIIDIKVIDHVIIGKGALSMREEGICKF